MKGASEAAVASAHKGANGLDARSLRRDFPLLASGEVVYLDSAATSQKPASVIEAIAAYYRDANANVHRGAYRLAEKATLAYEAVREKVARFVGLSEARGVVFTRGTTEAINLVAATYGRFRMKPGDEVLLTEMEHHSNLVPWIRLAEEKGVVVKHIPITDEGTLDLSRLDDLLTERTKIVSLVHVSNVLGTVNPVAEIAARAKEAGALVLVDCAQSVPHRPVNIRELGADFIAASGHKMLGPTGVGFLAGDPRILDDLPPYQGGGEMIEEVHLDRATYRPAPHRFEAGTPGIAGVVGLGAAIDYLEKVGLDRIADHERRLTAYALARLGEVEGLRILGPQDPARRAGAVAFVDDGVHPHDMAQILDKRGIAVRAGHHCCQPLHRRFGIAASTRASFYLYNDEAEVDALVEGIEAARKFFRGRT